MKNKTIRIDVTDPSNLFVHKGWARKGHTYVSFKLAVNIPDSVIILNSFFGKAIML